MGWNTLWVLIGPKFCENLELGICKSMYIGIDVVSISDRLGVTMHPAQPDRTFWQNRDCREILLQKSHKKHFIFTLTRESSIEMWILLHISAYFLNINIILDKLLETLEISTKKCAAETKTPYFVAAVRSGWAECIVTPGRSLIKSK